MKIWHKRDKWLLPLAPFAVIGVLLVFSFLFVDTIPPAAMTNKCMDQITAWIMDYARAHDRLPRTLHELPEVEGEPARAKDGWGREIIYVLNNDGTVALTSYGKDGAKGGTNSNADMTGVFSPKNKDGEWEGNWVVRPLESLH